MGRSKIVAFELLLCSCFAGAQNETPTFISLSAGIALPQTLNTNMPLSLEPGFNAGVALGGSFSSHWSVIGSFDYFRFAFDRYGYLEDYPIEITRVPVIGGTTTAMSFMLSIKYSLTPRANAISPYLVSGAGVEYLASQDLIFVPVWPNESFSIEQGSSRGEIVFPLAFGLDISIADKTRMFVQTGLVFGVARDGGQVTAFYAPIKSGITLIL